MTGSPRSAEATDGEFPGPLPASRDGGGRSGLPSASAPAGVSAEPPQARPIGSCHRELGLTLYRLRLERGLSLRALARCLGYSSHSAFADFEKARRMPGEPLLVAYERLFELPQGPLLALRARALAERAAWLTAIRESTVLGTTETLGALTVDSEARLPAPTGAPPSGPSAGAATGTPGAVVTRVDQGDPAEAATALDPAPPLARPRRRPQAVGGLAGLGAAVAYLLGRRADGPTRTRSIAKR